MLYWCKPCNDDGMLLLYTADHYTPEPEANQTHNNQPSPAMMRPFRIIGILREKNDSHHTACALVAETKHESMGTLIRICLHSRGVPIPQDYPLRYVWEGSRMVAALRVCMCYIYIQPTAVVDPEGPTARCRHVCLDGKILRFHTRRQSDNSQSHVYSLRWWRRGHGTTDKI